MIYRAATKRAAGATALVFGALTLLWAPAAHAGPLPESTGPVEDAVAAATRIARDGVEGAEKTGDAAGAVVDEATDEIDRAARDASGGAVDTEPVTEKVDDVVRNAADAVGAIGDVFPQDRPGSPGRPSSPGGPNEYLAGAVHGRLIADPPDGHPRRIVFGSARSARAAASPFPAGPVEADAVGTPIPIDDPGIAFPSAAAAFPALLALAMAGFVLVYHVLGRRDPKLTVAPVHNGSAFLDFS